MRKIKEKKGESLPETLMAVLISGLALMILAGATIAAVKTANTASNVMGNYYSEVSKLDDAIDTGIQPDGTKAVNAKITYISDTATVSTNICKYRYEDTGLEVFVRK